MGVLDAISRCFSDAKSKENTKNKSNILKEWSTNIKYIEIPNCNVPASILLDPDGVFTCKTIECNFETKRYVGNNIPDSIPCPLCGYNMVNAGLNATRSDLHEKLRVAGAGNQIGYKYAIDAWQVFIRIYSAEKSKIWKHELPELDYIFDVISKVDIGSVQNNLSNTLLHVNLDRYPYSLYENMLDLQSISINFINSNITNTPTRQVDLVPLLKANIEPIIKESNIINPSLSDASWYFYVWRQFGLVKCHKQGKYNMIYK